MEPLQREGRPGTTHLRWVPPNEPFDALTVIALDADRSIDAEATGTLPREHAVSVGFVEETVGAEVSEHTALDDALELEPPVGGEAGGRMEADLTVGAVREHAVEDDTVVVEVCVEG